MDASETEHAALNVPDRRTQIDAMVIADLVSENADLRAHNADLSWRNADLEADISVYRDIATASIHALHDVTRDRDRLRDRNRELRALLPTTSSKPATPRIYTITTSRPTTEASIQ